MYRQIDKDTGMLAGYLSNDPEERRDRNGQRMIVLSVAYDSLRVYESDGHRHNTVFKMPVVVMGDYTSYARLMSKGDCIFAIGQRRVEAPRGHTTNPLIVEKRHFGVLIGTGTSKAFEIEAEAHMNNEVVQRIKGARKQNKKKEDLSDDKFSEIQGDLY